MSIVGDTVTIDPKVLELESILYGTAATTDPVAAEIKPKLPDPASILKIFARGNG